MLLTLSVEIASVLFIFQSQSLVSSMRDTLKASSDLTAKEKLVFTSKWFTCKELVQPEVLNEKSL